MKTSRLLQVVLIIGILFFVQSSKAQINRDLPGPTANIQSMPAGSLVIAMDNTNQNAPGYFNLKAYGLIVTLLNNNKHLRWVITAGKVHNGPDFTVIAEQLYPTYVAGSSKTFAAGPFVIYQTDTAGCGAIINTFNNAQAAANRVKVFRTTAAVDVDIRYSMLGRIPKAAILNDGTKATIQEDFMKAASIPTANYAIVATASNLFVNCYTFASEPHNDNVATSIIDSIRKFVSVQGGNFLAQCHAIPDYENTASGKFQSSTGIDSGVNTPALNLNVTYANGDLSMGQFEGNFDANQEGFHQTWQRKAGSAAVNNFYPVIVGNTAATDSVFGASVSKLKPSSGFGGLVFYLGNHKFTGTGIEDLNGQRMYLNAFLTPAAYPSCPPSGPLAVKLTSFSGKKTSDMKHVQLFWTTAQEFNSKEFVIERSVNGSDFSEIYRMPSNGNSNVEIKYTAFDNSPVNGRNFYRLVEIDKSGVMTYSSVIVINFSATKNAIEIFPNPAKDFITISINDMPINNNIVTVTDVAGKTVIISNKNAGNNIKLDLRNLSPGVYFVKVVTEDGAVAQSKFIVGRK